VTGVPPGAPLLVHGMGTALAEPDWAPLTEAEVHAVLAHYPGAGGPAGRTAITWWSPRPMSAAARVRRGDRELFVKRHDVRVRTTAQLAAEHAFAGHLRARGVPAPATLATADGRTTVRRGRQVYEVHEAAPGLDLYRDAPSWTPFASLGHAHAAGAALARLHRAAAGFTRPARPPAVLTSSCAILTAADPLAAVAALAARRPGLGGWLANRDWETELTRYHLPVIRRAGPLLARQPPLWGHGDWHPSNLTWTGAGPDARVAGVFDFGLANRTRAAYDLATALERSVVDWLGLAGTGHAAADLDSTAALLRGYQETGPLDAAGRAAVAEVLPVVQLEYALSETEYFASVVPSPASVRLAWNGYLIGHTRWFTTSAGAALLEHVRRWAGRPGA